MYDEDDEAFHAPRLSDDQRKGIRRAMKKARNVRRSRQKARRGIGRHRYK